MTEFDSDDSTLSSMAGSAFWAMIRRNLPLIMAFFALGGTVVGGYASYRMMEVRMEQAERVLSQQGRELSDHIRQTSVHLDPIRDSRDREEILRRLARIESKLDQRR